jgi:single-strand DNA-binding protein
MGPPQRQPSATSAGAAEPRRIAMFNEAQLSVVGFVASEPIYKKVGAAGIPRLTMRVGWTTRRRDSISGEWVDGNTSFVSVTCWRRLADNLATCLRKGDPVLLRGRLDVRPFTGKDGQRKISVDVDANTLGHDLSRGVVAGFRRVYDSAGKTAEQGAAGEASAGAEVTAGDEAALAAVAADATVPESSESGGDEMFDDSAIEALAQDTDGVAAPF